MEHIKILIVDDHPMMREALKTSLISEDDLEVIGEASDAQEAFSLLKKLKPDVILMDLLMPNMSGVEAIAQIFESNPQAKIVVISSMENEENVIAAIQAGVLGYFPKTAPREYLLDAIRKAADGIPYLPSGIMLKLFEGLRKGKLISGSLSDMITTRQRQILMLLAENKTDAEIAGILTVQETTVRAHIHQMQQRLGLESRSRLIGYANSKKSNI